MEIPLRPFSTTTSFTRWLAKPRVCRSFNNLSKWFVRRSVAFDISLCAIRRLARPRCVNAYLLRGDSPTVEGAVSFFARRIPGLHVSSGAPLDLRGIRYNLYARPRINLWGDVPFVFPSWAKELLLLAYQHERLFDASLPTDFAISAVPGRSARMPVAVIERAVLKHLTGSVRSEMLREDNITLVGRLRNIRLDVLEKLVDHCPRRDIVRGLKFIGVDEHFEWALPLECWRKAFHREN